MLDQEDRGRVVGGVAISREIYRHPGERQFLTKLRSLLVTILAQGVDQVVSADGQSVAVTGHHPPIRGDVPMTEMLMSDVEKAEDLKPAAGVAGPYGPKKHLINRVVD
ncbi:hypothetical protein [Saccharopolyspora sp. ASAGF58]|uniref:hypothetical protein n=1 Tax=Saccharopolyspora sp. ASAGF58 TaxID=2719023 RepID=UPI001B30091E|nr:hypothetical protein [Saccharopolyspora sp. ASAGF58]